MSETEKLHPLKLPNPEMWSSIGTVLDREIHGGHQSRVFAAERNGDLVVAKLIDNRLVDEAFPRRIEMTTRLAETNKTVVAPIPTNHGLVTPLGEWLVVIYPRINGNTPNTGLETDVRAMARNLAGLHQTLDSLGPIHLPIVAALTDAHDETDGRQQRLHGDFSRKNLLLSDQGLRVFDFDECGFGPIEFELGNTLYMELFDATMSDEKERYEAFRTWFIHEYRTASGLDVADERIDDAIRIRISALRRWIDHPATAPIGIRTATPQWCQTPRSFVQDQSLR